MGDEARRGDEEPARGGGYSGGAPFGGAGDDGGGRGDRPGDAGGTAGPGDAAAYPLRGVLDCPRCGGDLKALPADLTCESCNFREPAGELEDYEAEEDDYRTPDFDEEIDPEDWTDDQALIIRLSHMTTTAVGLWRNNERKPSLRGMSADDAFFCGLVAGYASSLALAVELAADLSDDTLSELEVGGFDLEFLADRLRDPEIGAFDMGYDRQAIEHRAERIRSALGVSNG